MPNSILIVLERRVARSDIKMPLRDFFSYYFKVVGFVDPLPALPCSSVRLLGYPVHEARTNRTDARYVDWSRCIQYQKGIVEARLGVSFY